MAVARTTSSNLSNLMYLRQQQPMLGEPEFVDETVDPGQESALRVQNFMLDPKLGRPCLARGHGSSIRLLHQPRGSGKWTGATFAPPSIKLAWAAEKKARRTARYVVTRPDHADIIESTLKRLEEDLRRS